MKKVFYLIVFVALIVALAGLEIASARLPTMAPTAPAALHGETSTAY